MTATLLDRRVLHCLIFVMNGEGYRFRESMNSQKAKKSELALKLRNPEESLFAAFTSGYHKNRGESKSRTEVGLLSCRFSQGVTPSTPPAPPKTDPRPFAYRPRFPGPARRGRAGRRNLRGSCP